MRGREFIRIAKEMELIARVPEGSRKEAWLRSAISSIYYGTLHEVIDFLEEHGTRINRNFKVHNTVRESLKAKGYTETSKRLKVLHDLRKMADYELHKPTDRKRFKKALALSKLILREVGR